MPREECVSVSVPLNTVIKITPTAQGCDPQRCAHAPRLHTPQCHTRHFHARHSALPFIRNWSPPSVLLTLSLYSFVLARYCLLLLPLSVFLRPTPCSSLSSSFTTYYFRFARVWVTFRVWVKFWVWVRAKVRVRGGVSDGVRATLLSSAPCPLLFTLQSSFSVKCQPLPHTPRRYATAG